MGKHIRWIYSCLFIPTVVHSHRICQNDALPLDARKNASYCYSPAKEAGTVQDLNARNVMNLVCSQLD